MEQKLPSWDKISKITSNLLKKYANISSRFSRGVLAFSFWSTSFKHVVGFLLSTFNPRPGKGKGMQIYNSWLENCVQDII